MLREYLPWHVWYLTPCHRSPVLAMGVFEASNPSSLGVSVW